MGGVKEINKYLFVIFRATTRVALTLFGELVPLGGVAYGFDGIFDGVGEVAEEVIASEGFEGIDGNHAVSDMEHGVAGVCVFG